VPSSIHAVGDCGGNGLPNASNVGLRDGLKYNIRGDLVELFEDCFGQLHKARLSKFPSLMHCPLPCGICTSSPRVLDWDRHAFESIMVRSLKAEP